jgi:hypothetical protein
MLHRAGTSEYYQLAIFVGCFALYSLLASQLWLVAARLQAIVPSISVNFDATGTDLDGSTADTETSQSNVSPMRKRPS